MATYSATPLESKLAIQLLKLLHEALVGVDVTTHSHRGERFREGHATVDHEEGQGACCTARYAHQTVNEYSTSRSDSISYEVGCNVEVL